MAGEQSLPPYMFLSHRAPCSGASTAFACGHRDLNSREQTIFQLAPCQNSKGASWHLHILLPSIECRCSSLPILHIQPPPLKDYCSVRTKPAPPRPAPSSVIHNRTCGSLEISIRAPSVACGEMQKQLLPPKTIVVSWRRHIVQQGISPRARIQFPRVSG